MVFAGMARRLIAPIFLTVLTGGCAAMSAQFGFDELDTAAVAGARIEEYRLGAGDRVAIRVFGQPDLASEASVSGGGKVAVALIGQVDAQGLTAAALADRIAGALRAKFLVDPKVSVEIIGYRPFFILGRVNKPGSYAYVNGLTVRMAAALAGGFTRRALEEPVVIVRRQGDARSRLRAGLESPVAPGDVIEVMRRVF